MSITTQHPRLVQQKAFEIQRLKQVGASEELIRQVENDNRPVQDFPLGFSLLGFGAGGHRNRLSDCLPAGEER